MKRIVIKFGGTSVGTVQKIINAAKIVKRRHEEGNEIMVVVSAMSGTTNDLINRSKEISENFNKSELDVLMSSGEQVSSALLTGALIEQGIQARSWMGWQVPIFTNHNHSSARINYIKQNNLEGKYSAINNGVVLFVKANKVHIAGKSERCVKWDLAYSSLLLNVKDEVYE